MKINRFLSDMYERRLRSVAIGIIVTCHWNACVITQCVWPQRPQTASVCSPPINTHIICHPPCCCPTHVTSATHQEDLCEPFAAAQHTHHSWVCSGQACEKQTGSAFMCEWTVPEELPPLAFRPNWCCQVTASHRCQQHKHQCWMIGCLWPTSLTFSKQEFFKMWFYGTDFQMFAIKCIPISKHWMISLSLT